MRKLHLFSAAAFLSCALGLFSESAAATAPNSPKSVQAAVQSDAFALNVFRSLAAEQKGNIVFSPASLESVLRLLKQGARGATAEEFNALPLGETGVATAMQPTEATALFIEQSLELKPSIKADSIIPAPFAANTSQAAALINGWVKRHTKSLIPSMIDDDALHPNTRIVAANAICLEEKWLTPFPIDATIRGHNFQAADGSLAKVSMMRQTDQFRYAEEEDWQAIALFYRTDGRKGEPGCFIGILPKGDARAFAAKLTAEQLSSIRQQLATASPEEISVGLPSFTSLTETFSLKEALMGSGLTKAFTPGIADFSGFANEPLALDKILQRCYIKADEEGITAAVATIAPVQFWGLPAQPREVTFDRPFIWIIGDLASAAPPYFMGLYEQP